MRATSLFIFALLLCGVLSAITFRPASSLPATPGAAVDTQDLSNGLVEQARTYRKRKARRRGYRRPYYAPYFCARPYQLRYWQYYAPICYPL
ncbi:MAG: hypothetical protein WBF40_12915 [Methyloceanibacter sp.]